MPPAATGIAPYAARVVDELRASDDVGRPIRVLWPVASRHEGEVAEHVLAVYHLGNNVAFHRDIYRHAIATPGLVVLHDLALDDFVRGLIAAGDHLGFAAAREALRTRLRPSDASTMEGPLSIPWVAHVARRSRGIVVHSDFGRRYLEAMGCRTPVFVVPHPIPERPEDLERARARRAELRVPLEAAGMRRLVGVFGDLNAPKLIDAVLDAAAMLPGDVHLALVGRTIEAYDVAGIVAGSAVAPRVSLLPDLPDDLFLAWMCAADVVVDLRDPHRGEVSGSLARAMQAGRPTIVSATGTYLDVPDRAVVRVPPGRPEPAVLAGAIASLTTDDAAAARVGAAAEDASRAVAGATARGYARAITSTIGLLADPAHRAMARWARALAEIGVTEGDLAAGAGRAYAEGLADLADRGAAEG